MNNYTQLIVGAVIAIVGLVAGFSIANRGSTPTETPLSAVSSPDVSSPWLRWGGVTVYNAKQTMQTATTTLCAIQNPRTATSTIRSFVAQIQTGTSTAAAISLATSTLQYATSTSDELIADYSVASGGQTTVSFTGTTNANIIGPNQWLLFRTAGAGLGGYTYGGHCQATFEAIIP